MCGPTVQVMTYHESPIMSHLMFDAIHFWLSAGASSLLQEFLQESISGHLFHTLIKIFVYIK